MKLTSRALSILTLAAVAGSWACSGDEGAAKTSTSLAGATPVADGTVRTMASPTPSPSPSSVPGGILPGGSCPVGDGVPDAQCGSGLMQYYEQVDAVVNAVIVNRPELFDLEKSVGEGGYLVRNPEAFYVEVVQRLQAAGLCAYYDFTRYVVQVKKTDAYSEDYALILSNGHLRRGPGSYLSTCTPASFPLEPSEVIAYVRVGFYGIDCYDGKPDPNNNDKVLRPDCFALVTATPKKSDGTDVHQAIHGPDITWRLEQIDDYIEVTDFEGQPFNKNVRALDPGESMLCATVQGVEGCMLIKVLPE